MGTVFYFLFFPTNFDAQFSLLGSQLETAGIDREIFNPLQIIIVQTVVAMLISPALNLNAAFGEKFGWRAYLLPNLVEYGKCKALLLSSLIWGVWHWPVVLMGHNYGLTYTGAWQLPSGLRSRSA